MNVSTLTADIRATTEKHEIENDVQIREKQNNQQTIGPLVLGTHVVGRCAEQANETVLASEDRDAENSSYT